MAVSRDKIEKERGHTSGTSVKGDLVLVTATVTSGEVKRLVHVANEMD